VWQKFIANLLKASYESIDKAPSNKQILDKLRSMEDQLERQERKALYRYRVSIGIVFIGLSFGASMASIGGDWLIWVLVLGGLSIIGWSAAEYIQDIHKKPTLVGIIITIIGIVISAIQLCYKSNISPLVFFLGVLFILIGYLVLIIASRPLKNE